MSYQKNSTQDDYINEISQPLTKVTKHNNYIEDIDPIGEALAELLPLLLEIEEQGDN